jgi:three-Cys-motif partner protein
LSAKIKSILWEAPPHTLAKIAILQSYIDGFAGPGEYTNSEAGSPVAALLAAKNARETVGNKWIAGNIHCVFIEQDSKRFEHLKNKIGATNDYPFLKKCFLNFSFVEGLSSLRSLPSNPFSPASPLFAFIDPFGAKGVPFDNIKDLLSRETTEVLINLDSDGIGRIFRAEEAANHEMILNVVFGDDSWKTELENHLATHIFYRSVLNLYKKKLLALPNVRYVFAFEMRSNRNNIDYHLVFASQHPLGLEKMKEAMKLIARNSDYSFSDAHIHQSSMFSFDEPSAYSAQLFEQFQGRTVTYTELRDYSLNSSPFLNPKGMLKDLEEKGKIYVNSIDPRRRKGTFNEHKLIDIKFEQGS